MDRPPNDRAADNPWPQWPKIYRLDYGQEEAKEIFGDDPRRYLVTVKRFIADNEDNVKAVELVDIEWQRVDGRFAPKELSGSERVIPAELVLLAMGFLGPEDTVLTELNVARDERSNAKSEYGRYTTNVAKVFTAGDMRRGQSLVVWAINEGRGAAKAVDEFLMGHSHLPG